MSVDGPSVKITEPAPESKNEEPSPMEVGAEATPKPTEAITKETTAPVGKAESVDLEKPESMEITPAAEGDKPMSDEVLDEIEMESQNEEPKKKLEMKFVDETKVTKETEEKEFAKEEVAKEEVAKNKVEEKVAKEKVEESPEDKESVEDEEVDDEEDGEEEEESDSDDEGEEEEESDDDEEGEEDEEENEADKKVGSAVSDGEPPQIPIKMIIKSPPAASGTKKCMIKVTKVSTPGAPLKTPTKFAKPPAVGDSTIKKRGRPTRADMEEREKERQAAIARGEPDPELKRKRRKPAKLTDGASEQEDSPAETDPKEKIKKGRKSKEERREEKAKKDAEKKEKKKPGPGKGRKRLTEEEQAQREVERKRKYQEMRAAVKAKKDKRDAYLAKKRDEKRAQREIEKKAKEDLDKRMAELRAQYLDDNATDGSGGPGTPAELFFDENSQSSMSSMTNISQKRNKVSTTEMMGIHNPLAHVTAETLFEYKWPLDDRKSEHYFLQEQVTEFLEVKSFKRKFPDCPRRTVEMQERDFLIEMRIVNETQADLGLTAIPSSAVLDIMCQDFYDKYEAYMGVLNDRKERSIRNVNYSSGGGDIKMEEASKIAADFNKKLNEERNNHRKAFFDMQTFRVHYPKKNFGNMRVIQKPKLGSYPVALIPGQFVDYYKSYQSKELKFFPLNTVTAAPPKPGVTLLDMDLGSEGGSESDSGSSSSGDSGSDSDSDTDEEMNAAEKKTVGEQSKEVESKPEVKVEDKSANPLIPAAPSGDAPVATPAASGDATTNPEASGEAATAGDLKDGETSEEVKPVSEIDLKHLVQQVRPHAVCKMCQGTMKQNKIGNPEMLLNCTKCNQSCHPTCAGLHLDLIQHVTGYNWECTDCKMCLKCKDPADEDKMLFCDLCDRGYHIYCVGLEVVPKGRWHCSNCASCISCGALSPIEEGKEDGKWAHEMKVNPKGEKIFSHTMCQPCHKSWKRGNYCPECNGVFDVSTKPTSNCWVCSRTHHLSCVGLTKPGTRFICGGCQRKVQERTLKGGGGNRNETPRNDRSNMYSRTPTTSSFSRSGRRVTQINFANQF